MNLKIESNAYTKLDKMIGISNVNVLLGEQKFENLILYGDVIIKGEYYKNDNEVLTPFENKIPFEIVFTKENTTITNISICDFEYYEVAGRGIEASFNIFVDYELNDERSTINLIEEKELEEYKNEVTNKIDELLEEKIGLIDDNFLEVKKDELIITENERKEEKVKMNPKKDPSSVIKVIYYKNGEIVKDLCQKHNLSYDQVLKEMKNMNITILIV